MKRVTLLHPVKPEDLGDISIGDEIPEAIYALIAEYINIGLSGKSFCSPAATFACLWSDELAVPRPAPTAVLVELALGNPDYPATVQFDLADMVEHAVGLYREEGESAEMKDPVGRRTLAEIAAGLHTLATRLEDALEGRPVA